MEQDNKLTTKKFFTEKIVVEKTRFAIITGLIQDLMFYAFILSLAGVIGAMLI